MEQQDRRFGSQCYVVCARILQPCEEPPTLQTNTSRQFCPTLKSNRFPVGTKD